MSNFNVNDLQEVIDVASEGLVACNQEERAIERAVIPWCERHGEAVVGYSPFGHSRSFPGGNTPAGRVLSEIAASTMRLLARSH